MHKDFHHFKGSTLSRSEKIQRQVTEMILQSKIPDKNRENSIIWELKHSAGVCQLGRLLAQKRRLNIELAEIISILHDISAITTGKYQDHAKKGAEIAGKMLNDSHEFTKKEIDLVKKAIAQHSDKHIYSQDPYAELIKDADVLDCSLYENAKRYYQLYKPPGIYREYEERIKKVRQELNLPVIDIFRRNCITTLKSTQLQWVTRTRAS